MIRYLLLLRFFHFYVLNDAADCAILWRVFTQAMFIKWVLSQAFSTNWTEALCPSVVQQARTAECVAALDCDGAPE